MTRFPEEATVVNDLYEHYTLGFDREDEEVVVWCDRCDAEVCTLTENIANLEDMELYERIVTEHEKVGVLE